MEVLIDTYRLLITAQGTVTAYSGAELRSATAAQINRDTSAPLDRGRFAYAPGSTRWQVIIETARGALTLDLPYILGHPTWTNTPEGAQACIDDLTPLIGKLPGTVINNGTLDSPVFTGTPQAPTAPPGTGTTQIATTEYVDDGIEAHRTATDPHGDRAYTDAQIAALPSGGGTWGGITGTLSDQTDLQSAMDAKAPIDSPTFTGIAAAPTPTAGDNTTKIATTAFVATALSTAVAGLLDFKGPIDCSSNPNYPSALKGDTYYVSVAGKVGGASGLSVDVGDAVIASADNAGGTQASVGSSWFILEHNLAGALLAANNLSDLASASAARSNIGLVIGTDVASQATADALKVEVFSGVIKYAANATYTIDTSAAFGYTVNTIIIESDSGTVTAALKIGATAITGISAVSVTTSAATGTATAANVVSVGNRLILVLSSNADARSVKFTIKYTRS